MLNSSSIRHTVNMKLLLLASVICFAAVLAAPADKEKREILPGDPRYGTDHQHHHHHHHENEVPKPTYGPPDHKPGSLINGDYSASDNKDSIQVPSTSYGIPDNTQLNNYLAPIVDDKKTTLLKVTIPKTDVRFNSDLNIDYQAPSAEAPVTSYGVPDIKTIHEQPKYETTHVHKSDIGVPLVKVTAKIPETQGFAHQTISTGSLPSFTSFNTGSLLPSVHSSYPTSYTANYHQSLSSIPVKTVDHHVQVQVPQPYPVPVTKHVSYPVPFPHAVEVPKAYHVRVPYPVQVTVDQPYPVEVPRPVPYPVPQYIRTSLPQPQLRLQQQHHVVDTVKANPIQSFFENTASTFQDTIGNLPSFTNPFQNFPNPLENFSSLFENFQIPSIPSLPSLPSFTPSQSTQAPSAPVAPVVPVAPAAPTASGSESNGASLSLPTANDAVTIENPIKESIRKPIITPIQPYSAKSTQKEYVQPIDDNGGYVY
ncbi:uncharacterized protein LOC105189830 isoform X2 [Harpegnathos saltator]|uniref:uncharacterized protein LOC105189830 isoform X2 n=1 Tax=Harpegnathos saltator TaxID=610380 RepID=UPI000590AF05|nr:uncharacterized protein LOC105189830 isoform X2 [Harpegnathos saltator]